jgi:predicted nucleotidyltransferase
MDKTTVVERVKKYAVEVAGEMPESQVILFGSYVSGKAHENSDIDVAIIVKEINDDYLTVIRHLYALAVPIDPMIEPHLLFEDGDNGGFLQEVQRTGEVIYRAA